MKHIVIGVTTLTFLVFMACKPAAQQGLELGTAEKNTEIDTAQWVIRKAIEAHGSEQIDSHYVAFMFRNKAFMVDRSSEYFSYRRTYKGDDGTIVQDVLDSNDFWRNSNGETVALSEKDSLSAANSVNSVVYFSLLPYFLEDAAVHAKYIGISTAFRQEHYEILVTFSEENGGKDHDDQYAYWINAETFHVDYLAYNYTVNGGGARFREAYQQKEIDGMRFQNYINYKPVEDFREVLEFDDWYAAGKMDTLSMIDLENVSVKKK